MKEEFPSRQNVLRQFSRDAVSDPASPSSADAADPSVPRLLAAVVGVNSPPTDMTLAEIEALGDRFTRNILLKGEYPLTLASLIAAIEKVDGGSAFPIRSMFVVAEGGQFQLSNPQFDLNARLVFIWRKDPSAAPDLMLSTAPSTQSETSLLQLIAWSGSDGAFHYFERLHGVWGWAGNSFHALREPSRGKGPFDSHVNGSMVMKELKFPWTHWHSQSSVIPREAFPANSEFRSDPLFSSVAGAEELEAVVKGGVIRWTRSRIAHDTAEGSLREPVSYFRQIVTPTTENLVSSSLEFKRVRTNTLRLPSSFFFDIDGFEAALGVDAASEVIPGGRIEVDGGLYADAVRDLGMKVAAESGAIAVEGDTHFCFLVPERAFEDTEVARQLVQNGSISGTLLLSLLMVDFVNPVLSSRRSSLLKYCPTGLLAGETLAEGFLRNVTTAAVGAGGPEEEFLSYWLDPDLTSRARTELHTFFEGIQNEVNSREGVIRLVKLADWRKSLYRVRDIDEFTSTTSVLGGVLAGPVTIDRSGVITV